MARRKTTSSRGSVGAGLNARDDALDPAPARGAVVELRVTAHLARMWGGDGARHRAGFQAFDMTAQGRRRRDAKDEVDPVGATPVEDLRAAIVAVGAQQDRRSGQLARIARSSRRRRARISAPFGRLAGRSTAVIKRPSPSNTTIGWNPYSS